MTGDEKFMSLRDDEMELAFIADFVQFGARLSLSAALPLLREKPRNEIERKRWATGILLHFYIALEDFAILLRAMLNRRTGIYLHLAMSQGAAQGTTHYPAILKKPVTAHEVFDELGFETVNVEVLKKIGYEITEADLDNSFGDFAASVKQLGEYVEDYNSLKNRLKHGKAVFGIEFDLEKTGDVAHLDVAEEKTNDSNEVSPSNTTQPPKKKTLSLKVDFTRTSVTDQQARIAVISIAKLAKMSASQRSIDAGKAAGVALTVAGVWLVVRG